VHFLCFFKTISKHGVAGWPFEKSQFSKTLFLTFQRKKSRYFSDFLLFKNIFERRRVEGRRESPPPKHLSGFVRFLKK
jgi:hypothetical protein